MNNTRVHNRLDDMLFRLDRITAKLETEVCARGLDRDDRPVSNDVLTAFTLLTAAVGIAARGLEYFTDEELTTFEKLADKIIAICSCNEKESPIESV